MIHYILLFQRFIRMQANDMEDVVMLVATTVRICTFYYLISPTRSLVSIVGA